MKYEKPELVALGAALENVQFLAKKGPNVDCADQQSISPCEQAD